MKKFALLLLTLFAVTAAGAQTFEPELEWEGLDSMLFREFKQGTVYFNNGRNSQQMLNYDPNLQRMMFIQDGMVLFIGNLDAINYMVIEDRIFTRYKGDVFFEQVRAGNGEFYVSYRTEIKEPKIYTGFEGVGTGGGFNIHTLDLGNLRFRVNSGSGQPLGSGVNSQSAGMNLPILEKKEEYFIFRNGKYRQIKKPSELAKIYGHKKEIRRFAIQNNIDPKKREDVFKLVEYASTLNCTPLL